MLRRVLLVVVLPSLLFASGCLEPKGSGAGDPSADDAAGAGGSRFVKVYAGNEGAEDVSLLVRVNGDVVMDETVPESDRHATWNLTTEFNVTVDRLVIVAEDRNTNARREVAVRASEENHVLVRAFTPRGSTDVEIDIEHLEYEPVFQ